MAVRGWPGHSHDAASIETARSPGLSAMIATLKHRSEFLRIRGGARWATAGFVLETKSRTGLPKDMRAGGQDIGQDAGENVGTARFGFTVTKKLGNAVTRNRIRRRLREAVRLLAPDVAKADHDYVLIARSPALDREFKQLARDLEFAFQRVHRPHSATSRGTAR